ncbi:MAG: hypothetical protein ACMUHX_12005 [bacterium]
MLQSRFLRPCPFSRFPIYLSFLGLLGLILSACAFQPPEPCVKQGKAYGVTDDWIVSHDWDSCYKRAVSYAQGECRTQAMDQFRMAVRQRPNDQWRARSYGMHVLDEYFPHREMGILYLREGKLQEAIEELSISLATADSAKAKYYLNQARKGWLEKTGLDRNPPGIRFYAQPDISYEQSHVTEKWLYTNMDTFPINGEALDDYYVSSILINEQPLFIDLAQPVIPFCKGVSLNTGENHFLFRVTDLTGKEYKEELRIFLDQQGPGLFFSQDAVPDQSNPSHLNTAGHPDEKKDPANMTIIRGIVFDAGGVHTLVIGEKEIPLMRGVTHKEFKIEITSPEIPAFWARDMAGNVTHGNLAHILSMSEQDLFNPVRVAGNVPSLNGLISGRRNAQTERTPGIYIEDCPATVFQPDVVILGRIETWNEITEAWINDEPLLSGTEADGLLHMLRRFWHGKRTLFYFTRLIKGLKEGENRLTIRVKDADGRSAGKDIMVEYRVREIDRIGNRWRLAILPFLAREMDMPLLADPPPGPLSLLTEGLHLSFFRTKRFNLVERERIDSVMNELELQSGNAVDGTTGPRLGKLLAAEVLLSGSFREAWDGRDRCLEIIARLVDVETGSVLSIKSVYNRWQNKKDEEYLLSGLARIFQQEFPLVQGEVINKKRHIFEINLTRSDMIKQGMKIIVYRSIKEMRIQNILGEARMEDVNHDFSSALPSKEKLLEVIRIGDLVITK